MTRKLPVLSVMDERAPAQSLRPQRESVRYRTAGAAQR
jgi:hypothetical protein